jgi:aminoglycoside phosphotransferase (APT) family kinase protein
MNLEDCLPADLQLPATTITKVAAGLSGAGVYRVDADAGVFVLKTAGTDQPLADWQRKLHMQQLAANAGLAPRIVHADEPRRAIVSEFVVDRSFPALYGNPATREAALDLLGRTLRRVHELPLPPDVVANDPKDFLASVLSGLDGNFAMPPFVVAAAQRVLTEESPPSESALVFSHNDVNPSNLVYDGERLILLDWDTSGVNDPFYDLAAISVFMRMDDDACKRLLAAHDDAPVASVPARFMTCRRTVAVLCGVMFMRLAHQSGHAGATGDETLESTLSLSDFYKRLMSGAVNIASAEGQWLFGLALTKESAVS